MQNVIRGVRPLHDGKQIVQNVCVCVWGTINNIPTNNDVLEFYGILLRLRNYAVLKLINKRVTGIMTSWLLMRNMIWYDAKYDYASWYCQNHILTIKRTLLTCDCDQKDLWTNKLVMSLTRYASRIKRSLRPMDSNYKNVILRY